MDSSELSLLMQKTYQSLRRQTAKNKKLRNQLKELRAAFEEFDSSSVVTNDLKKEFTYQTYAKFRRSFEALK
jgi:hypothetical protein